MQKLNFGKRKMLDVIIDYLEHGGNIFLIFKGAVEKSIISNYFNLAYANEKETHLLCNHTCDSVEKLYRAVLAMHEQHPIAKILH